MPDLQDLTVADQIAAQQTDRSVISHYSKSPLGSPGVVHLAASDGSVGIAKTSDSSETSRRRRRKTESREELLSRLLDPVITLEEAAMVLNVCPTTVRRYTNRGILPHERSKGNQRRFKLSSVLAFMESNKNGRPMGSEE